MIKQTKDIVIKNPDGTLQGYSDTILIISISSSSTNVYLKLDLYKNNIPVVSLNSIRFTPKGFQSEEVINQEELDIYNSKLNKAEGEELQELQDNSVEPIYEYTHKLSDLVTYLDFTKFDLSSEGITWLLSQDFYINGDKIGNFSDYFENK